MRFVKSANLPENTKIILIGEKYAGILKEKLENIGMDVLLVPDNPFVDERLSGHADLSVLHLGGEKIALAPHLKGSGLADELSALGMELYFPDMVQGKSYPEDAALNICLCGKNAIFNPKSASAKIVDYLTNDRESAAVEVKQGYSKCSVCVLDENALITSDPGIYKRAVEHGLDVLKITPGCISLPGFDYGFIGGASFKLSRSELAFTGHLNMHPDRDLILEFLSLHNIKVVYITENHAFDIGSAIQIVEK